MTEKKEPLGTCDHCLGPIPPDLGDYTSKGRPRLYCSIDCRNAANSHAGNEERTRKLRERVARGEWQNPHLLNPPTGEEQARRASLGRKREVEAGIWRNPALTDGAREKLSRPRRHGDNSALHRAIEKLRARGGVRSLTPEEREAYLAYRRQQRRELLAGKTPEEREALRAKWRAVWRKRKKR